MDAKARREREQRAARRERRRGRIVDAAWQVAAENGWPAFSLERVASRAELARATLYDYFPSVEALVLELAERAMLELSALLSSAHTLEAALDAPVRFARGQPAAFSLLFPVSPDPRPTLGCVRLEALRTEARTKIGRVARLARRAGALLAMDSESAAAFLQGISLGATRVPALLEDTTLRHRWQTFCLAAR